MVDHPVTKAISPSFHRSPVGSPLRWLCGGLLALFRLAIAGLVAADVSYLGAKGVGWRQAAGLFSQPRVLFALRMGVAASLATLVLVMLAAR